MPVEGSMETVLRIAEIASIIGGGGLVAYKLGRSTGKIEDAINQQALAMVKQSTEISDLKVEMKKLGEVLTMLAVQETRLDSLDQRNATLERRYDELRHGEGYVLPLIPRDRSQK